MLAEIAWGDLEAMKQWVIEGGHTWNSFQDAIHTIQRAKESDEFVCPYTYISLSLVDLLRGDSGCTKEPAEIIKEAR